MYLVPWIYSLDTLTNAPEGFNYMWLILNLVEITLKEPTSYLLKRHSVCEYSFQGKTSSAYLHVNFYVVMTIFAYWLFLNLSIFLKLRVTVM